MNIIVTGAAGFIGMHVCKNLLDSGHSITGIDNLNAYYDQTLKQKRLECLTQFEDFTFYKQDIADKEAIMEIFAEVRADCVIHLAAQAGVRYSLIDPDAYANSNLTGFLNILEACRQQEISHLIYASSSSIYGSNDDKPFKEIHNTDHPVSLYGATKKANEVMAHSYSHLFQLPTTGLRFFTVYGPWGRPDMSIFKFINQYFNKQKITLFDSDKMLRDFTYIDDIVNGICGVIKNYKKIIKSKNDILNLGYGKPVQLNKIVNFLIKDLKLDLNIVNKKKLKGDVNSTHADIKLANKLINFKPMIDYKIGIHNFFQWYVSYYKIKK